MHQIWLELGALQGKEIRHFDVFNVVRGRCGRAVYFYSDPDRLQAHLTELSPADSALIRTSASNCAASVKPSRSIPFSDRSD